MAAVARKIGSGSEISTSPGRDLKSTSELVIVLSPSGLDRIPRRQLHARAGFGKHALVAGVELLRHHPPGCPSGAYSYVRDAPSHDKTKPPPARNYEHDLKSLSRLPWRTPSRINDRCVYPPRLRRARGQHSANPQRRGRDAAQTKPASAQPGRMALICLVFLPGLNSLETAHTLCCGRRDSIAAAPKSLSPMATIPPSRARHPDLGSPAVARIPFFPLVPSPMEAVEPLESQQVGSATFCQDR